MGIKARVSVLLARKSSRIRVVTSFFGSVLTIDTIGTDMQVISFVIFFSFVL